LEERGQVRRGWFVAGLGAAQFALPGAVDRLRAAREPRPDAPVHVLAVTDPAQPYGAALAWPDPVGDAKPTRTAGALVILHDGAVLAYLLRDALITFPGADTDDAWIAALAHLVDTGRIRSLELRRIDGGPARESAHAAPLRAAGFQDGYRGLVHRRAPARS
jgi:ATP-dependent Lhr-like helicase